MSVVDPTTVFGRRVTERLTREHIAWLVTVDPHGTPQPTPVWFGWDPGSGEIVLKSEPRTAKLRNVRANPRAAVHLNSSAGGGDVVVLVGTARIDDDGLSAEERAAYDAKYADGMRGLGTTPEDFHTGYSVTLRITPERLRGF